MADPENVRIEVIVPLEWAKAYAMKMRRFSTLEMPPEIEAQERFAFACHQAVQGTDAGDCWPFLTSDEMRERVARKR